MSTKNSNKFNTISVDKNQKQPNLTKQERAISIDEQLNKYQTLQENVKRDRTPSPNRYQQSHIQQRSVQNRSPLYQRFKNHFNQQIQVLNSNQRGMNKTLNSKEIKNYLENTTVNSHNSSHTQQSQQFQPDQLGKQNFNSSQTAINNNNIINNRSQSETHKRYSQQRTQNGLQNQQQQQGGYQQLSLIHI
eukprot:TRINITY_DN11769_c0_g1_i4.p2 TRINITY_DN11769_c0_g1~~TRINITY_DN11769_c0_g1_i4.p2  ORF type:complete len:190 (-),score=19.77 TRINITY_DN11769_c0_g1_i4:182-751(-)